MTTAATACSLCGQDHERDTVAAIMGSPGACLRALAQRVSALEANHKREVACPHHGWEPCDCAHKARNSKGGA
jgi:hypothetical protein